MLYWSFSSHVLTPGKISRNYIEYFESYAIMFMILLTLPLIAHLLLAAQMTKMSSFSSFKSNVVCYSSLLSQC